MVDVWQLLLRLLVLTLIVLAMSRLFAPWLSNQPATHNTVIVIDGSASMMQLVDKPDGKGKITLFDLAKQKATAIAERCQRPQPGFGDRGRRRQRDLHRAPLEPGHEHAVASLARRQGMADACGSGLKLRPSPAMRHC